ncbi:MarR family transcriptional regulator [Clostridium sp. SHJSY1]|uniref:MarR family winged helix-turn-helix transcriptional regulator n=1 Tax=Clostridium sp. SHJSY1 TaxID=2942483 RepID=UPI0028743B21|nr:MarR family transcriptional regulator [Clostridium sp. SHJSY1]MDS0527253.1 MarR family transcriptional regulator [Clostridium sp. SHJSY1]
MGDKENIIKYIDSYYESWFLINNIYHIWANEHGIQENTLFTLYIINTVPNCTQSEICKKIFLPKQTVSDILSGLEKNDYIVKETNMNDRRNKVIKFTKKGLLFATSLLEELKQVEIEAFQSMSKKQQENVVSSFSLLVNSLTKSFSK